MRKEEHRSGCPINLTLEVFGDRWSLLIIRDIMFEGKKHFGEFLQSEERIATNILTDRLTLLEKEGILIRTDDPEHKLKYIYSLTKKGIDLLPVMAAIGEWGIKYQPYDAKKHENARKLVKGGREMQRLLKKDLLHKYTAFVKK